MTASWVGLSQSKCHRGHRGPQRAACELSLRHSVPNGTYLDAKSQVSSSQPFDRLRTGRPAAELGSSEDSSSQRKLGSILISLRVRVVLAPHGFVRCAAESLSLTPGILPSAPSAPPSAFAPLLRRSASPRESNQREGDPGSAPPAAVRVGRVGFGEARPCAFAELALFLCATLRDFPDPPPLHTGPEVKSHRVRPGAPA